MSDANERAGASQDAGAEQLCPGSATSFVAGSDQQDMDRIEMSDAMGLPTARRRGWVLAAASVASFIVALDLLVVTTALETSGATKRPSSPS